MTYTTIEDPVIIKRALELKQAGMFVSDISKKLSEETGQRITQMALWRAFETIKEEPTQDDTRTKKRRQGQTKPDGTKATPKPICPKCGEYLKRSYTREMVDGKQRFVKSGWMCPSSTCDYIIKDFVEIEDENE